MDIVPFFVADRPMSLRLLKGLPLSDYPIAHIGIMAHANTSQNFQQIFHDYPCDDKVYCDAAGGPCTHREDITQCPLRSHILSHTIKMCDSGIFTREGATLTYEQLFEAYLRMDVQYGIMIDVFRNGRETVVSAVEALNKYQIFRTSILDKEPNRAIFELVAVAQGETVEEYLQCYKDLKSLGFSRIAVGGLLQKVEKTARYAVVRSEDFMYEVLGKLRELYPEDWLFALGCFNPNRFEQFKNLRTWGDYKGWIFQYEKKNETFDALLSQLLNVKGSRLNHTILLEVAKLVDEREILMKEYEENSKRLNEGKRELKAKLRSLYEKLLEEDNELAKQLEKWITYGLVDKRVEQIVSTALKELDEGQARIDIFLTNICRNRELKALTKHQEKLLESINERIKQKIMEIKGVASSEQVHDTLCKIEALFEDSEREHRFSQVRMKMAQRILAYL